jgi:hypothetical protein
MALTDVRRFVLVAIACALIWIGVIFRPVGIQIVPARRVPPPPNATTVAAGQLAQANDRWRLLDLRDSIAKLAPKSAGRDATILIDQSLPNDIRRRLGAALASQWQTLVPRSGLPVAIAIVVDTVKSPHGHIRLHQFAGSTPIESFLPSAETGGACISLAHLAGIGTGNMRGIVMQNLLSSETIAALLNPCALLATFGRPGPHVSEWLQSGAWSEARFADWGTAPSPWKAVVRPDGQGTKAPGWLDGLGDPTWHIRGYVAQSGIACLAGESGTCAKILLNNRRTSADSAWRSSVVSSSGTNAFAFYLPSAPAPLGPAGGWVVSEMVRTLGRERFARFWHSSLPVDSAFHDASGQRLDDWVRDWGRRMYGAAAVGPSVSGVGLATGAVILVLTLGVSIVVERRRRVA